MNKLVAQRKTRVYIRGCNQRFQKFAFVVLFASVLVTLTAATPLVGDCRSCSWKALPV
jgi:hypothetical protein